MSKATSTQAAVRAAREGAAFFVLGDRQLVVVSGDDRVRWLNGMVSRDVAKLSASEGAAKASCPALVLTAKGRVVAALDVVARDDVLWLDCERAAVPGVLAQLGKLIVADDVELRADDATACFALEGPRAAALFEAAFGSAALPSERGARSFDIAATGHRVVAVGLARNGVPGIALYGEAGAEGALHSALAAAGDVAFGDSAARECLRIAAGRPGAAQELVDVLPAEVGLEYAIAIDKGCYIGQEVVARLQSRAKPNWLLVGVELGASISTELPATLAADGREVGRVTSVSPSVDESGAEALAIVRKEHAVVGAALALVAEPDRVATVTAVHALREDPGA